MMALLITDKTYWPLTIICVKGCLSFDQHCQMIAHWDKWFAYQKPFLSLRLHLDEAALTQHPDTGRVTKKWLTEKGAAQHMQQFVTGMAIVVPEQCYQDKSHLSVEAVFKIPGGIFPNLSNSLHWLSHISQPSLFDIKAVQAHIDQITDTI